MVTLPKQSAVFLHPRAWGKIKMTQNLLAITDKSFSEVKLRLINNNELYVTDNYCPLFSDDASAFTRIYFRRVLAAFQWLANKTWHFKFIINIFGLSLTKYRTTNENILCCQVLKKKNKREILSLFFSSPSMTLNDFKVTISYFGKKNSIFFSALRDQKKKNNK